MFVVLTNNGTDKGWVEWSTPPRAIRVSYDTLFNWRVSEHRRRAYIDSCIAPKTSDISSAASNHVGLRPACVKRPKNNKRLSDDLLKYNAVQYNKRFFAVKM